MKKTAALILALAMAGGVFADTWQDPANRDTAWPNMTPPFDIRYPAELAQFVYLVGQGTLPPGTVRILNSIELKDHDWVPPAGTFSGTLDTYPPGSVKTIFGLSGEGGLFDTVAGGTVRNIVFSNITVTATSGNAGAVARTFSGTLENVSAASGSVTGAGAVGGLVGTFTGGSLVNGFAEVAVTSTGGAAGGLFGEVSGAAAFGNSFYYGAVSAETAGGIVGTASAAVTIENAYSVGTLSGTTTGGLVGALTGSGTLTGTFGFWRKYSDETLAAVGSGGGMASLAVSGSFSRVPGILDTPVNERVYLATVLNDKVRDHNDALVSAGGTPNWRGWHFASLEDGFPRQLPHTQYGTWSDAANRDTAWSANSGTISSGAQLAQWAYRLSQGNATAQTGTFTLTQDIDLSAHRWDLPIGTSSYSFRGILNGASNTIWGLVIDETGATAKPYAGLFGRVNTADAKLINFTVAGADVWSSTNYVGTVAGSISGGSVSNVFVLGQVIGRQATGGLIGYQSNAHAHALGMDGYVRGTAGGYTGGIVAYSVFTGTSLNNTLVDVANLATVSGASSYIGGVAGYHSGFSENCFNLGTVSNPARFYVGGVFGRHDNAFVNSPSSFLYNGAPVSGSSYVGGVIGYSMAFSFDCENSGDVGGFSYLGGIIGVNYLQSNAVGRAYNQGAVTATLNGQSVGGIIGFTYSDVRDSGNFGAVTNATWGGSATARPSNTGGVAGYSIRAVSRCYNAAPVVAGHSTGGVVGFQTNNTATVTFCENFGEVIGGPDGDGLGSATGGVLGRSNSMGYFFGAGIGYDHVIYGCTNYASVSLRGANQIACGGIVGYYYPTSVSAYPMRVADCANYGAVSIHNQSDNTGGIFGWVTRHVNISNCFNYGNISADHAADSEYIGAHAGGISGEADGYAYYGTYDYPVRLIDCVNVGDVSTQDSHAGGISALSADVLVSGCANFGAVSSAWSHAGGIVSQLEWGTVTNSYNAGTVTGEKSYVGGIVGAVRGDATVSNPDVNKVLCNLNEGKVTGGFIAAVSAAGGIVGSGTGNIKHALVLVDGNVNTAEVTGPSNVGGIYGYANVGNGESVTIRNNINFGSVSCVGGTYDGSMKAGGIAGHIQGANTRVVNNYNLGSVSGDSTTRVGGLFGQIANVTDIKNNYSGAPSVTAANPARAGGLFGDYATAGVANNYWLIDGNANAAGGTPTLASNNSFSETASGSGIWVLADVSSTPLLTALDDYVSTAANPALYAWTFDTANGNLPKFGVASMPVPTEPVGDDPPDLPDDAVFREATHTISYFNLTDDGIPVFTWSEYAGEDDVLGYALYAKVNLPDAAWTRIAIYPAQVRGIVLDPAKFWRDEETPYFFFKVVRLLPNE